MLLFELLQISLGNKDVLSHSPSKEEWDDIYYEAERQAVTGILLHGIDKLKNCIKDLNLNIETLLQWIGVGQMIEQRNRLMDDRCVELLKKLSDYGVQGTILKGQGIACLYDNELKSLRQSGDIDVYVDCGLEKAMAFAKSLGQTENLYAYKHLNLDLWDDTEVEMHVRPEVLLNLWKNRRLQKWFREHQDAVFGTSKNTKSTNGSRIGELENSHTNTNCTNDTKELVTPSVEFNVFYILLHIYRHFLYEGVGMRQIMDYYFVLRMVHGEGLVVQEFVEAVCEFGMEKFAKGLMWVMQEVLGMPREWMLWEPDEKEGQFILSHILEGGNFGHYKARKVNVKGKIGTFLRICSHNLSIFTHYPYDTLWAPIYFMWLKLWKIKTIARYRLRSEK